VRTFWGLAATLCVLVLAGCSGAPTTTSTPVSDPVKGAAMHGTVYGGRQAIVGANVYLYAANTTGYGSASIPLLVSPVTTDANGSFSITGDYTCPSTAS
jgi:hypothetical protein